MEIGKNGEYMAWPQSVMTSSDRTMEDNSYVAIDFLLQGDPIDLEELYAALGEARPTLLKHEDGYFLRVYGFGIEVIEARRFALEYVSQINGAARLIIPGGYQQIGFNAGEWYLIGSDGQRSPGLGGVEWISPQTHFRGARIIDEDFQNKLRRRPRTVLTGCAGSSNEELKLRHILQIMSKASPSWTELYLVQELTWGLMESRGMKTDFTENLKHFKKTAHSWSALGMQARHGNKPEQEDVTREHAMSYNEALVEIRGYVCKLLEHIGNSVQL